MLIYKWVHFVAFSCTCSNICHFHVKWVYFSMAAVLGGFNVCMYVWGCSLDLTNMYHLLFMPLPLCSLFVQPRLKWNHPAVTEERKKKWNQTKRRPARKRNPPRNHGNHVSSYHSLTAEAIISASLDSYQQGLSCLLEVWLIKLHEMIPIMSRRKL